MPAKSKEQFKFMKAVESGSLKVPGLSSEQAAEYTKNNNYKDLPKRKFKKIKQRFKNAKN